MSGERKKNERGFFEEPLPWCPECERLGWPKNIEETVFGSGQPWVRGRVPDSLRQPARPSGPVWGSKLGSPGTPGASAFAGPRDISGGPSYHLEDIRQAQCTLGHGLLVDARGRILLLTPAEIHGLGPEWKQRFSIRKGMGSTPTIVGERFYFTDPFGIMNCYDLSPDEKPELVWSKQFCEHVGADPSALAANEEIVVSTGMEEKPAEGAIVTFRTHMYAVDATTGKLKWKAKLQMPSLMVVPSIAAESVVCMSSTGGIDLWAAKDGKLRWQVKGEMGSMSTGGAIVVGQMVIACSNRRAKKGFNAPFGGKGAVRAYNLKDGSSAWEQLFDLEANALPAMCPVGPNGKPAIIACLGASPGPPQDAQNGAKPNGDHWDGQILALDPQSGSVLWKVELPRWESPGCAGNVAWLGNMITPPAGWVPPVCGADGTVYANWNVAGTLFVLDGATGTEISKWNFGQPMAGNPVLAPGTLYFALTVKGVGSFTQEAPPREVIMRPLELPFAGGSGTEHFWPNKSNDPRALGLSKFKAPLELDKPAWVFKTPLKLIDCWYGNSPIMDAQRNLYMGGNWSDLFIIRPDGTLRGSVYPGPYYSTPCVDDEYLYVTNSLGYALCFRLDTLELKWSKRYCDWTSSDNYSILAWKGSLFVPGLEYLPPGKLPHAAGKHHFDSGHTIVYRLSCEDGSQIYKIDLLPFMPWGQGDVLWNFTPVIYEEYMVFMDFRLGVYCCKWETGDYCWHHGFHGSFSTGNQCAGANGLIYMTGNKSVADFPGQLNDHDGVGVLRGFEIATGTPRMSVETNDDRGTPMACNQGACYIPPRGEGKRALVAAPFSTNITGHPGDSASTTLGDAFAGKLLAVDAETGEVVWERQWDNYWRHTHVGGSWAEDPGMTWPDSWGGLSVDSRSTLYAHWMDGMIYAVDGMSGDIISSFDTGNSSNAQILLAPGMAVFTGGFAIFCFRDKELEDEWLEEAKAAGDPRAKVPLMDIPPSRDDPPREGWNVWRGPQYAEEQNLREGEAWIEKWAKGQKESVRLNAEYSAERCSEAKAQKAKKATSIKGGGPGSEWLVIAGGDKGIVVREGKSITSAELPRLNKGARVRQLKKEQDRLQYELIEGNGPATGWISLTFKGAPLVQPVP